MPFGAEFVDDGVRFRLWAPGASRVDLCLEADSETVMTPLPDGFYECHRDDVTAGTRYGFRIDGDLVVPDPASRCNPDGVHERSELIDPGAFDWQDADWQGRPWNEAVVYELHVGTFSVGGTYDGVAERLAYLADLGVTAVELMPVAAFPGRRGWGYDGVLPFAPASAYGRPEDLKRLVQAAHGEGLMVILDVVYNHFGPDGNYLHLYAPQFFTDRVETPWGQAIHFDGEHSRMVREFFIHNALYWLGEFHLDGLRIDAVHAIFDRSRPDILEELSDRVRAALSPDQQVHLVLENDDNAAHYLRPAPGEAQPRFTAQWNDDFHHAIHVLLTGETRGYYEDYGADPPGQLARCLAEGFAYQGEYSQHRDRPRGEPSAHLPPTAFVSFLQNHDQVGNRALGERLSELTAADERAVAEALLLLSPHPPLLFMGEEFGASSRFPYFCDHHGELAEAVRAGRRREFQRFPEFSEPQRLKLIPDPNAPDTFRQAKLDWRECQSLRGQESLERYRRLLKLRRQLLVPRLPGTDGRAERPGERLLGLSWRLASGGQWHLLVNLDGPPAEMSAPTGRAVYHSRELPEIHSERLALPPWTVVAFLDERPDNGPDEESGDA
ncbi:MAG: malto-oligosyltrehalose trehalohydrolase [Xanthomonadales bacterium]|nr:malto-oligosyltrehalose trehalohydrolase [Xanthomonadales bacterium]